MAKKTDEKTLELIKEVNRQKKEIEKAERPNWITNCSFSPREGIPDSPINLHVEASVKTLLRISAFLIERERSYKEAVVAIGVADAPAFEWAGSSLQDWLEDIKTRISKIQIGAKKKKLEALESRLNQIISPELRAELELEAIQADLNK